MKKLFPTLVCTAVFLIFATAAGAQSPAQLPAPSPTPDTDVVKISTSLIRVDVTVTDAKGKAVIDLRPDEIEIYENGKKQRITEVKFISGKPPAPAAKPDPAEKNAAPLPAPPLKPESVRRTIALLVDDLTLSFESTYYTRRALKKFVDEQMEEGDLVAIVRTGAGIGALQQFTSDKRMLYAAIEKVRWNPVGNGGISAFAPLQAKMPGDDAEEPEPGERTAEGVEREFDDFRESYFATGTLGALDYVIRGMSDLPGRKSAILFSDGFKMTNTDATGFLTSSLSMDPIRRLIESANRASVVIYAMDPRGLVITGITAADDTSGRTSQQIGQEVSGRSAQLFETQSSLKYISEETGGFALINNNDLPGGIRRVLEDQSYYLIAYEPDDDTFDPAKRKFNKLDVKVLRKGAYARTRSGFVNVADRERPAGANPAIGRLDQALASPFAVNGIDLRLNALFVGDEKNNPFVRSLLHIDVGGITFTDAPNGDKKAVFEVLAITFGDNGQQVDRFAKSYTMTMKANTAEQIKSEGIVYQFVSPVTKPGPYQYRVAIRDAVSGRVGSASQFIEVPNLKKKKLTLSSLLLENIPRDAWQKSNGGADVLDTNPMSDTALRRAKVGSVLRYGFVIFNAKSADGKPPHLTMRSRIFRDGKLILDGAATRVELIGQTNYQRIAVTRALALGSKMEPGDYILQAIVTDEADPKKPRITTQVVQFELIN
jgi:VWFA-related protein